MGGMEGIYPPGGRSKAHRGKLTGRAHRGKLTQRAYPLLRYAGPKGRDNVRLPRIGGVARRAKHY
jgi:hypothetical protein